MVAVAFEVARKLDDRDAGPGHLQRRVDGLVAGANGVTTRSGGVEEFEESDRVELDELLGAQAQSLRLLVGRARTVPLV
ncbi:MAG TPA: hypothetical protein VEM94_10130 [Candidatus Dormibacteraeota bacterium]|nr:hypothetical protein [Candidatus Dormibacteraeota bacterium]